MGERAGLVAKTPETKKQISDSQTQQAARIRQMSTAADRLRFLQRTAGNRAVSKLIRSGGLQPGLRTGKSGIGYVQDADKFDAYARMADPGMLRQEEPEEEEEPVQARYLAGEITRPALRQVEPEEEEEEPILSGSSYYNLNQKEPGSKPDTAININNSNKNSNYKSIDNSNYKSNDNSNDNRMPGDIRDKMEGAFQSDFSDVAIIRNSGKAREIDAIAYTQGNNIHFASGRYHPYDTAGQELLAHELAHVVQQRQGRVRPTGKVSGLPVNNDPVLEKEADDMGKAALQIVSQISDKQKDKYGSRTVQQGNGKSGCCDQEVQEEAIQPKFRTSCNFSAAGVVQKVNGGGGPPPLTVTTSTNKDDVIVRGEYVQIRGQARGGAGGYRYSWSASNPGAFRRNRSRAWVRPQTTTTYTLTITDSSGATATSAVTVSVIQNFTVAFSANNVCDGAPPVTLTLTPNPAIPAGVPPRIAKILWVRTHPAARWRGNPSGRVRLQLTRLNAMLQSTIRRPLWYSTQTNHCNVTGDHRIEVRRFGSRTNLAVAPDIFTVSAAFGTCLDGWANVQNTGNPASYWSGSPRYVQRVLRNGNTRVTIRRGSFRKNVQTHSWFFTPANSQFRRMVRAEERYHELQLQGRRGRVIRNFWNHWRVIRDANAAGPFESPIPAVALAFAQAAFVIVRNNIMVNDYNRAVSFAGVRCQVEREAKRAVGARYRVALPCAYPMC